METLTPTHSAETLRVLFDLHTRLFNNVLADLDDAETNTRARETVNHIKWLAGHLTSTRHSMGKLAGMDEEDPYGELFSHGHGIRDNVDYPGIDAIRARWNRLSEVIAPALSALPAEALSGPAPARVPVADDTLGGFLAFLMHHEAYHIGQMGILRRYLGKEAMQYG